jgi:hypothetical protein
MKFKDWLGKTEEVSTSTADIAVFARPIFSAMSFRMYPEPVVMNNEWKKKKKDEKKGKKDM